jgi:hypothetical protein
MASARNIYVYTAKECRGFSEGDRRSINKSFETNKRKQMQFSDYSANRRPAKC